MNINYVLIIIVALLIGVLGSELYLISQPAPLKIDPLLQGNPAANEIAALGIEVDVEDLGTDDNGYTVRGQTSWYSNGTVAEVVLDEGIDPNSYEAHAILYHELYHVLAIRNGLTNDEASADDYAASRGYLITDAYHGIH